MSHQEVPDSALAITVDETPRVFDVTKPDDLAWYLPIVGPSVAALLPTAVALGGQTVSFHDLAWHIGLQPWKLRQTLRRASMFYCGTWVPGDGTFTVRRFLSPLSRNNVARCPEWFQAAYAQRLHGALQPTEPTFAETLTTEERIFALTDGWVS